MNIIIAVIISIIADIIYKGETPYTFWIVYATLNIMEINMTLKPKD